MKRVIYIIYITLIGSWANAQDISYKALDEGKIIYFTPRQELKIKIIPFQDDFIMEITSQYQSVKKDKEYISLKEAYLDYQVKPLPISSGSYDKNISLYFPSLDRSQVVQVIPTSNGPVIYGEIKVSLQEVKRVRQIPTDQIPFIIKKQTPSTIISHEFIDEEAVLLKSECHELFKDGDSAFNVMKNYYRRLIELRKLEYKYASTLESLSENLFNSCIGFDIGMMVTSFHSLIDTQVFKLEPQDKISGITKISRKILIETPLHFYRNEGLK